MEIRAETRVLEQAQANVDAVVLKRLKFVLKIIKALIPQPNTRNRQCPVFIYEVLDALKDWSGNPHGEIRSFIDMHIFPIVCRLISTFSKAEFTDFQQYYSKYIITKWEETCNLYVLDFLAEMYGFVTRIAPPSVAVELVQAFQQEKVPIPVSFVILPSIIKNLPEAVAKDYNVTDKVSQIFLRFKSDKLPPTYLNLLMVFWNNARKTCSKKENLYQLTPTLHQYIATSFYLEYLEDSDVLKILQLLMEWSESFGVETNSEGFLLIATVFLHSIRFSSIFLDKDSTNDAWLTANRLMKRMVVIAECCRNKHIRVFATITVLQRILEYSGETNNDEVLTELQLRNQENGIDADEERTNNALLESLEVSVQQISSEVKINEPERKRIRLMIDSLQNLLDK